MPPLFGILNTHVQRIDPDMISRMKEAAVYSKPRMIESIEPAGGMMAAAVVVENPLTTGKEVIAIVGEWIIAADATLYRREELIRRMERLGHAEIERRGDAELILEAWLKWGKDCVKYLYGDFAFVIFNQKRGEIFCGRDPLGVRPFFYSYEGETFVFSSELRYVLASFKIRPSLRPEYLLDTLVTIKTSKELSPFEKIFRLKPGHYLDLSGGIIDIHQYWQIDPDKTIRLSRETDYIDLLQEKLLSAVKMRCSGISKLGSELSGGLDSSAITGIAADITKVNDISFSTFSNVFPLNTEINFKDEREFISAMQIFKSFDWVGVDKLNHSVQEMLQHAINIQGCFIQQGFSIFNRSIYEAAGEHGIQVLLSGFGGDEMVSAHTGILWNELISEQEWNVLYDELYYKGITLKSFLKSGFIAARYLKSMISRRKFITGVFTPELLDRRFANLPLLFEFAKEFALRKRLGENYKRLRRDKTSWRQYDRIMLDHLPQRLEYCYTAAAQYGLEYRYPLLDTDLVETYLALPPWVKQHHGINRYIFRQVIKDYVPDKIRKRDDKSGSTIPQMYFSLLNEKDKILEIVNSCSGSSFLEEIFDLSKFPQWHEKLVKREMDDMNYLMPGAFYDYLMIMLYYRDRTGTGDMGQGTGDKGQGTSNE